MAAKQTLIHWSFFWKLSIQGQGQKILKHSLNDVSGSCFKIMENHWIKKLTYHQIERKAKHKAHTNVVQTCEPKDVTYLRRFSR